jgi:hypothetical protein
MRLYVILPYGGRAEGSCGGYHIVNFLAQQPLPKKSFRQFEMN